MFGGSYYGRQYFGGHYFGAGGVWPSPSAATVSWTEVDEDAGSWTETSAATKTWTVG